MFAPSLPRIIGIASLSLILCACGGGSDEDSKLGSYDDSESALDSYDDSETKLDGYDDSGSALDSYDDSETKLDGYDDSGSALDSYDDSETKLDGYDDSGSALDSYDDSETKLDGYDDSGSALDSYDDSETKLDGYDDSESALDSYFPDDDQSDNSEKRSNSSNTHSIDYLDCSNLNPNKVYFLGALRDGLNVNYALIDPEDTSRFFCAGFDGSSSILIATHGLIYKLAGIKQFIQDKLKYSTGWHYPTLPQANDVQLSDALADHIFLRNNNSIYFEARNNIYSINQPETPHYENLDGNVHIVTPDGGIVISSKQGDALYYIDSDLNRIQLAFPADGVFTFMSARMHGSDDIWLHVIDSYNNDRRWNVNMSTQLVTDEGSFGRLPDNMRAATDSKQGRSGVAKMNSAGELIQMGLDDSQEEFYKYVIFKRFVESTEAPTQILLSDAGYTGNFHWDEDEFPYVHIQVGMMVTGF